MNKCFIKKWFLQLFRKKPNYFQTRSLITIKKTNTPIFEGNEIIIETIIPYENNMLIVTPEEFHDFCCYYRILSNQSNIPNKFYKKFGDNYKIFKNQEQILT